MCLRSGQPATARHRGGSDMAAASLTRCPMCGLRRNGIGALGDPHELNGGELGEHGGGSTGGRQRPRDRPSPAAMSPAPNSCIYAH
jgi:hypothetical protein